MASGAEIAAILRLSRACEEEGVPTVLARLVSVEGSHYRPAGARMLIAADGRSAGAISAGCLEADLRRRSGEVLSSGRTESIDYDSRSFEDLAWGLGTGCNGVVRVLLSRFDGPIRESLARISGILAAGGTARVATVVAGPRIGDVRVLGDEEEIPAGGTGELLVEVISAPVSLLIAGAGPDAVPLARLAAGLGWNVTILSSRDPESVRALVPDVAAEVAGLEAAKTIRLHGRSAAVVMSHRFADDALVLEQLLGRGLRYLGVLGPRERTARLLRSFAAGNALEGVRSPVGLDIGGETAEEIALSIVAEIQEAFSKAGGAAGA
jgi:xanthine/CO dehydrogenase XdhC/CoxF family maturation factor